MDGGMEDQTGASAGHGRDELISRVRVIEGQPLAERAAAYAALHDELAHDLEAGPAGLPSA
ncbi:MAG: hypothetical protein J0I44_01445 [Microbacterium sp.]|uniref:hypothetical protein n=1 Tax=Microbacterium sp. TaxID=51671 RepID=UPI001ACBE91A|nr:hypothetical protein [Microbacterium sp.]MBN9154484.1 hypothetical protein [Microbacterium sp.]MBN9174075.1 hypothetical protein [Microbacterium sp.]MBN9183192.1 hypothetical protein [Microbacterium sp.]MBN9185609.1 hypothetical protein [Microbacterium sp.]MBN9190964.1 hypothetical protein [Microbacterium sp.]